MCEYHLKTANQLAQMLQAKEVSSLELCDYFLARIERFADLNAFISVCPERARAQAQAADKRLQQGEQSPLLGVPFAHKDLFCTKGVKTSCGSKMLDNFIAPYDATVVEKLDAVGLVMLGKLNMDEFAMGASNETSFYGAVLNPWDKSRVAGGSSGGTAAAVAARLVPIATGTDTGGSIRQPAAFCGLTGIKPTYGSVSRYGMVAFASSLDQGGVLGQNAADCAAFLQLMAGFDERDSTSSQQPTPDYSARLNQDIRGMKLGVVKEFLQNGLEPLIQKRLEAVLEQYRQLGVELVEVSLPNANLAVPAYYIIAPAECSSNLSRFDGVRYGYRATAGNLQQMYQQTRSEGFGQEVKRRIMVGTYALSAGFYDAYYLKAQKIRRLISEDYHRALNGVDALIAPTCPDFAYKLGQSVQDPVKTYLADIYTIGANLAGLPAINVPAGFEDKEGSQLPVGVQLIGNAWSEPVLLNLAHQLQQHSDWHQAISGEYL